ncbi:phosphatidylserine/phosphatidylglycerophosphate/cardiolipin synthase family protein [Colwelliaceae bacterium 6471]
MPVSKERVVIKAKEIKRTQWLTERIFFSGDEYFQVLEQDIEQAKFAIDVAFYIFILDNLGLRLLTCLKRAANRGVAVRILVDGVGSANWNHDIIDELSECGIEVHVYHPQPWRFSFDINTGSFLARFFNLCSNINKRDHRKCCIIDDHIAWVGSFNVVNVHIVNDGQNVVWRDTGIRVSGLQTKIITDIFNFTWRGSLRLFIVYWSRKKLATIPATSLVRTNITRRLRRNFLRNLYHRIAKADSRLWITNAYFVPLPRLQLSLIRAAFNGVDVRILLPGHSDVIFMPWLARIYYHALLRSGVKIYEYQPAILHAKTILFDNIAIVGSSNLNHRSLLHDVELDIVCKQPESINLLEQKFLDDQSQSLAITLSDTHLNQWWKNMIARFLQMLRYWM